MKKYNIKQASFTCKSFITPENCKEIRKQHIMELEESSKNASTIVYGREGGELHDHQKRLGKKNLE